MAFDVPSRPLSKPKPKASLWDKVRRQTLSATRQSPPSVRTKEPVSKPGTRRPSSLRTSSSGGMRERLNGDGPLSPTSPTRPTTPHGGSGGTQGKRSPAKYDLSSVVNSIHNFPKRMFEGSAWHPLRS